MVKTVENITELKLLGAEANLQILFLILTVTLLIEGVFTGFSKYLIIFIVIVYLVILSKRLAKIWNLFREVDKKSNKSK